MTQCFKALAMLVPHNDNPDNHFDDQTNKRQTTTNTQINKVHNVKSLILVNLFNANT